MKFIELIVTKAFSSITYNDSPASDSQSEAQQGRLVKGEIF